MTVAGLSVMACLIAAGPALGVCTQAAYHGQPSACASCSCPGPCTCIPAGPWGYTARQWQPWPGNQCRQDIVFPQSIGVERLATPRGERPKPMPREIYGKPRKKADIDREMHRGTDTSIHIREGAPVEPIETPLPFAPVPESN